MWVEEAISGWRPSWLNGLQGCWNTVSHVSRKPNIRFRKKRRVLGSKNDGMMKREKSKQAKKMTGRKMR